MVSRRNFLITGSLAAGAMLSNSTGFSQTRSFSAPGKDSLPMILSTWDFGLKANEKAAEVLNEGGSATDAVEKGINLIESDPDNASVGIGGYPDRDGCVTLDACIMDAAGRAGSVTFLQHIANPVSVARKVMEDTPHVMLSGDGALQFALQCGFKKENLLTENSRKAWEEWKKKSEYKPVINIENHDTIGMLVMDVNGNIAGGCSTSGLAYKMHGRVGDSPIIGAGLFVDNEVGAAVATGLGETVMKTMGAFLVVELIRNGKSPQEACEEAIHRIVKKIPGFQEFQVGIIALSKSGATGAYAIQPGFTYALGQGNHHSVHDVSSYLI